MPPRPRDGRDGERGPVTMASNRYPRAGVRIAQMKHDWARLCVGSLR